MQYLRTHKAVAASVIMIAGALAATAFPTEASAGVAGESCPSGWTARQDANGYQLCSTPYGIGADIFVHIVDLKVGRVVIRTDPRSGVGTKSAEFTKRTVDDWWSWTLNYTVSPTGGQLQAVVNASFLTREETAFTPVSFPQKVNGTVNSSGSNPDTYAKRVFGLYQGNTKARIADFAYKGNDYATVQNNLSNVNSAIVGYAPDGGPTTDNARKTYVGGRDTDGDGELDRLYILVSTADMTKAQTIVTLRDIFKTSANVQLDGGGSTQMKTRTVSFGSLGCLVPTRGCRAVPDVLAIYAGQ